MSNARDWARAGLLLAPFLPPDWVWTLNPVPEREWYGPEQPPSWTCPRCHRATYHPQDVRLHYCACCGSEDGLLPKLCDCPPANPT